MFGGLRLPCQALTAILEKFKKDLAAKRFTLPDALTKKLKALEEKTKQA